MSTQPTVWIVNEAGHDYDKARDIAGANARFSFLTEDEINPHRVDRLSKHIARGIIHHASEDDFVLISGTPMVNVLAIWIWMIHFKKCQVLQWDAKQRVYRLTTIEEDSTRKMMQSLLERG
jgi:hypothetical protein